jgi:hypothetical protein
MAIVRAALDNRGAARDPRRTALCGRRSRLEVSMRRRVFLGVPVLLAGSAHWLDGQQQPVEAVDPRFPAQPADVVRDVVGASHNNLARVRELVDRQPALARATWDWGFGDWESALGAASHVGNRPIAEYLISRGARPSIFSAAMLGQLAVVRAFVDAQPGIQRVKGPHGITLLAHARAGGPASAPVVAFLEALGDADDALQSMPLTDEDRDRLLGTYVFGPRADERFEITSSRGFLWLQRSGGSVRRMTHRGSLVFAPAGAEDVRIRFTGAGTALTMTIDDPGPVLTARRLAAGPLERLRPRS